MHKNKSVKRKRKTQTAAVHKSNETLTVEERQKLLKECFYTDSEDFKKMWEIIQRSLDSPSQNSCIEKHHIIPKSYFKKVGRDYIDNGNLVSLPAYDHYKVHFYAWKCSKPLMEKSMTFAFNFMAKKCMKINDDNDLNFSSFMYEQFREEHRKSISRSLKDYYSDEKTRNEISSRVKEKWADPDYKAKLKELDKIHWTERRERMFPDKQKNDIFKKEIEMLFNLFGPVPNRVAANIFNESQKWFTEDQQKYLGIDHLIAKEKTISKETFYVCNEIGFIGSKSDLAYIFNVSESVIVDAAKCGKKINNLAIEKEQINNFKFFHETICKFLYPLYKKQGEHLFDTLREIFNKMDKLSKD